MATYKTYTISTDTLNNKLDEAALHAQIKADATVGDVFDGINRIQGSSTFDAHLVVERTAELDTAMDAVVAAHNGEPLDEEIQPVKIASPAPAFADKYTPDGKSLYARETGIAGVTIAAGQTSNIIHTVSFPTVKINGAQIYGCKLGDNVNFKILDSSSGTYTTVPNYMLNQFGFNVNMPEGNFTKEYPYDADLYYGMQVLVEYTNNGSESVTIYVNLDIHEVK